MEIPHEELKAIIHEASMNFWHSEISVKKSWLNLFHAFSMGNHENKAMKLLWIFLGILVA